ncbi:hypothetical protein [Gemmiger sp. An194]|uniref:hypothetical protein n=1 Tax=Gemmiger sp. An194 TaxID=1965582 RepID=UPI001FFD6B9B|nr:hypothetical protein [Gemmiger sp. An194]
MNKQSFYRIFFYILGLLILALGLTLNTKAGLGVSPIISVSYSVAQIFELNFGNTTLFLYCVFMLVQLVLHAIQWRLHPETDYRLVLLMDVLQIPLSLVFTRFLNLFGAFFPDLSAGADGWTDRLPLRLAVLLAILCTGVGAALSLSMRIVPNPGDGIVQTLAD